LSAPVISFAGDPADPAGTWVIEVKLRDAVRKVELPLRTTFELTKIVSGDNSDKATGDVGKQLAVPGQLDMPNGAAIEPLQSEVAVLEKSKSSVAAKLVVKEPSVEVGNWVVNLIAYKKDQLAERKAEEFAAKGITAKMNKVEAKGEDWYRLSVDGFESQYEAMSYAARAKKTLNLDSVWISKNKN
jgi:cell division protein FtsN